MAEVRYKGDDPDGVHAPNGHGLQLFERMEWVDLDVDAARALAKRDDFELRSSVKAAKTRKEGDD
jgi:hypothetical protein